MSNPLDKEALGNTHFGEAICNVSRSCEFCGRHHAANRAACAASGKECFKCGKKGHFKSMCRGSCSKSVKVVHSVPEDMDNDAENSYSIAIINYEAQEKKFLINIRINSIVSIPMPGAEVTIISKAVCGRARLRIVPPHGRNVITVYNGSPIQYIGSCDATLYCSLSKQTCTTRCYVVPAYQCIL